jgi:hypothetical protein
MSASNISIRKKRAQSDHEMAEPPAAFQARFARPTPEARATECAHTVKQWGSSPPLQTMHFVFQKGISTSNEKIFGIKMTTCCDLGAEVVVVLFFIAFFFFFLLLKTYIQNNPQ